MIYQSEDFLREINFTNNIMLLYAEERKMSTTKNVTSENFKEVYNFGLSSYRISEKKNHTITTKYYYILYT